MALKHRLRSAERRAEKLTAATRLQFNPIAVMTRYLLSPEIEDSDELREQVNKCIELYPEFLEAAEPQP